MFNCLAKNAAVTEVSFEDAKKLLLAAREQRVSWDEQTLGICFLEGDALKLLLAAREQRVFLDAQTWY
jgi:hypothetical protein